MRIAIFTNNYLPNPYGVSKSVESFRREFEKRGHAVFVFAPSWKGYADRNPNVFRYPSVETEFRFRFPLAVPYSREMERLIEGMDFDIVHSQHPDLLGMVAARWARKKNVPLVFTWHTLYDRYAGFVPFLPEKMVAGYAIRSAVRYANKADTVIAPTESIVPELRKWGVGNDNLIAIPTGVDEEQFKDPNGKRIREKHGFKEGEKILLLVSRLTPEKNVGFAVRSVLPILRDRNDARMLIVGDGHLADDLKKAFSDAGLSDRAVFAGVASENEIKDYYAAADIFVYSSKSETQGMSVSEAMHSGLPIVAVKATGVSSLVSDGINGLLVEEDEAAFGQAVERLLDDNDLRRKFSDESARIAKESFSASVSAERMLKEYRQAIDRKSKR